jgi:hypothetical protein
MTVQMIRKAFFTMLLTLAFMLTSIFAITFGSRQANADDNANAYADYNNCVGVKQVQYIVAGMNASEAIIKAKQECLSLLAPQPEVPAPGGNIPDTPQDESVPAFNSDAEDLTWQRIVPNSDNPGLGQSVFRASNMWFVNRHTPFATSKMPYADYQGATCTFASRIAPGKVEPSLTDVFLYPLGESTGTVGKYESFAGEDIVYTCSSYGAKDLSGKEIGGIAASGGTLPSIYIPTFISAIKQSGLTISGGARNVKATLKSMTAELRLMKAINSNLEGYSFNELTQVIAQATQIKVILKDANKIVVDNEMLEAINTLKATVDSLATGNQVVVAIVKGSTAGVDTNLTIPTNPNISQWLVNDKKVG